VYADPARRDELLDEVQMLTPGDDLVADDLDQALAETHRPVVLVVPLQEQLRTISRVAAVRDSLAARDAPLVLVVPRGGAWIAALREHPFLASWLRGRIVDLDDLDTTSREEELAVFRAQTGQDPAEFLTEWRAGRLPDDVDHNLWAIAASTLVNDA
jgi:hypothetical protein